MQTNLLGKAPQKLDFLVAFYITCLVLAELMGAKTFPLISISGYQLNASVAIFFIPILFSINDIVTEVYGKEKARSIIRSGLLMIVVVILFSVLATLLPASSRFGTSEAAYDFIFTKSIRISMASLVAFTFAEFLDVLVFVKLKAKLGKSKLWLRTNLSNFLAQFIDTTVFITLAFYSLESGFYENLVFLVSLILPYWMLKNIMSIIETPIVYLGISWLKREKL